jgi:glycosyltransferase involved in cell wall biosynthesis
MRVLLLHDYGTISGGAEVMVANLRDALRARGHQASLFTSTARPLPLPIVADETCFGTVTPLRRGLQAANPHALLRLRQVLRAFRPDVVFVKMFLNQLSPLVLPLLRAVPSVLSVINYNLLCPINTKTLPDGSPCHTRAGSVCHANGCMPWLGVARAAVQRRLTDLSVFDHVFANSHWVAQRLRAEGVRVDGWVHNGVPQRGQRPPLGERPVVGYAGRLVPRRGVDTLLAALTALRERVPEIPWSLPVTVPNVAGSARRAFGCRRRRGFRASRRRGRGAAMAPAGAGVPSRWENRSAFRRGHDASAAWWECGRGLSEQVVEGETGYRVPPGVPWPAGALARIVADRDHAERLGRARQRALAHFTFDIYVSRILEILEAVRSPH